MNTLDKARTQASSDALHRLKHKVLPELELVIAGTPTGPLRNSLTTANIILNSVAEGIPITDVLTPPEPA